MLDGRGAQAVMKAFERPLSPSELQGWHVDKLAPLRLIGTLVWSRRLPREEVESAWRDVVGASFPLRARVEQRSAEAHFIDHAAELPPLRWVEDDDPHAVARETLADVDLPMNPGDPLLRGVVVAGRDRTSLVATFQHMHLDGRSGAVLLEMLADRIHLGSSWSRPEPQAEGRAVEDLLGPRARPIRDRADEIRYVLGAWRARLVDRPLYGRVDTVPERTRFGVLRDAMAPEASRSVSDAAKAHGVSVGNLFTAAYLQAIAHYERATLPVTIPLSEAVGLSRYFRAEVAPSDLGMYACMFKATHRLEPGDSLVEVARRVRETSRASVDRRLAVHGLRLFGGRGWSPSVERALKSRLGRRQFTFSNVGRVGEGAEDPTLVRMDMNSTLSVLASTLLVLSRFRGQHVLNFAHALHAVPASDGEALVREVFDRVERVAKAS